MLERTMMRDFFDGIDIDDDIDDGINADDFFDDGLDVDFQRSAGSDFFSKSEVKIECPYCEAETYPFISYDGFAFCGSCHRKFPWKMYREDDRPVQKTL